MITKKLSNGELLYQIEKYKTRNGKCPLDEFILELIKDGRKIDITKIQYYVELLEKLGPKILCNEEFAKKLNDSIYELRPKSNRILYCYCSSNGKYILLHGFKKKTQKTPLREIEKANKEANDYKEQIKNGK